MRRFLTEVVTKEANGLSLEMLLALDPSSFVIEEKRHGASLRIRPNYRFVHRHSFPLGVIDDHMDVGIRRLICIDYTVVVFDRLDNGIHDLPSIGALTSVNDVPDHLAVLERSEARGNVGSPPRPELDGIR